MTARKTVLLYCWAVLALDDVVLTRLFHQFNREKDGAGLSVNEQLARLRSLGCPMRFVIFSHGPICDHVLMDSRYSRMSVYKLRSRLGVPTVRNKIKQGNTSERLQAILDLKQSDIQGRWGVAQVRQRLANKGLSISRYVSPPSTAVPLIAVQR